MLKVLVGFGMDEVEVGLVTEPIIGHRGDADLPVNRLLQKAQALRGDYPSVAGISPSPSAIPEWRAPEEISPGLQDPP